jgi:hypothetical protein
MFLKKSLFILFFTLLRKLLYFMNEGYKREKKVKKGLANFWPTLSP